MRAGALRFFAMSPLSPRDIFAARRLPFILSMPFARLPPRRPPPAFFSRVPLSSFSLRFSISAMPCLPGIILLLLHEALQQPRVMPRWRQKCLISDALPLPYAPSHDISLPVVRLYAARFFAPAMSCGVQCRQMARCFTRSRAMSAGSAAVPERERCRRLAFAGASAAVWRPADAPCCSVMHEDESCWPTRRQGRHACCAG